MPHYSVGHSLAALAPGPDSSTCDSRPSVGHEWPGRGDDVYVALALADGDSLGGLTDVAGQGDGGAEQQQRLQKGKK